jgi:hypothetical protein
LHGAQQAAGWIKKEEENGDLVTVFFNGRELFFLKQNNKMAP